MGVFDGIADLAGTIKIEGEKITSTWLPSVPTKGAGTVEWNIPTPIAGCFTVSSINSAYCGIVVLMHDEPLDASHIPQDGVRYEADPTADPDLHSGDKINGARVIGAFYEGDLKAQGENMTTKLVVTDVDDDNAPHYIGVYAVDCQLRYHSDGIRAYSDMYGDKDEPDTPSISAVVMNDGDGILPSDGTNLEIGREYGFDFDLNERFPGDSDESNRITVSFDGSEAQTYGDMLDVINEQLANIDNPPVSAEPPNSGSYYWNDKDKTLSVFNGFDYSQLDDYVVSDTDPTDVTANPYWLDQSSGAPVLKYWNGTTFDTIDTIVHPLDPADPICDEIWFDGSQARKWSGTTWCNIQTFNQPRDPSAYKEGDCTMYWYNEDDDTMYKYSVENLAWEPKTVVTWKQPPNAIASGEYWFNPADEMLRERVVFNNSNSVIGNWNLLPPTTGFVIGETIPVIHPNIVWYKKSEDTFYKHNGNKFEPVDVVYHESDPTDVKSCSVWWNSVNGKVFEYDTIQGDWDQVQNFVESTTDPLSPEEINLESFWNDTSDNELKRWNGSFYEVIDSYIDYPTDPTLISDGDPAPAWYSPVSGEIKLPRWNDLPSQAIFSRFDPTNPPTGLLWFDDSTKILKVRNGSMWQSTPYRAKPIKNVKGAVWYDIQNKQLRAWNGKTWAPTKPKVFAYIDDKKNIVFQTRETGSRVSLLALIPGHDYNPDHYSTTRNVTRAGSPLHAAGYKKVYTEDPFEVPRYINSQIPEDEFLWDALPAVVQPVVIGSDGLKGTPSYDQLGIGTDGTPDERRELAHSIRVQLGWPTVDVELTDEQIDTCITGAFESLRKRSDVAYRRNFYLLDTRPGVQNYQLTNSLVGFDRIAGIMGAHRRSGAFGGGYSSNSVFDQMFAQQLFGTASMGGFDLTTLHLSQQYLEQLEIMFATRLNFHFNESNRTLYFHQDFHKHERILLDTYIDRTEQEMFKDRWVKSWIERFALGGSRLILSEIRGKYASLPGAGGGVTLNAADLASTSAADFAECYAQLDDFVASNAEMWGASDFVIG